MRFALMLLLLVMFVTPTARTQGVSYPEPEVGGQAPDFALPFANRDSVGFGTVSLSQFAGEKITLIAFYPADWSGGCTREVCTFRDNFDVLAGPDVVVLGISGDSPYSHHEWAKHHDLPFLLLSDLRHTVAPAYHSYNPSSGYNKRTVFVIDKDGRFAYIDLQYSTRDMESFKKLQEALAEIIP